VAKDIYHNTVRVALEKDGWTITDDPLTLKVGKQSTYIDLGAERLLAAEKQERRIAVEVKSFISPSLVKDLEQALGQYIMYGQVLSKQNSDLLLYLAMQKPYF
jgi:XisH protein